MTTAAAKSARTFSENEPALDRPPEECLHTPPFLTVVDLPFPLPLPVFGAMLAIWQLQRNLQRRFPLHEGRAKDYIRFLAWCAIEGRCKYAILRSIPEWETTLGQKIVLPEIEGDLWSEGYSVALFLFGVARHFYTLGPMLGNVRARHQTACVFWRGERHKHLLPPTQPWQQDFLAKKFGRPEALIRIIRRSFRDCGKSYQQLGREYGLADLFSNPDTHPGVNGLGGRQACFTIDLNLLDEKLSGVSGIPRIVLQILSKRDRRQRAFPTECQMASVTGSIPAAKPSPVAVNHPFGVNLYGYARGETGIAEDVRHVALALHKHDIPFCIINMKLKKHLSQQDLSVEQWLTDKPRYAINLFCMTGFEQVRFACAEGIEDSRGRYNIGLWPWELPRWPVSCDFAAGLVDEIWGISRFTADSYRQTHPLVQTMTLSVTVDPIGDENRDWFGLPAEDYLFVFSFDFDSRMSRKNPMGVIRAFRKAFPCDGDEKVGLVLKVSNANSKKREWRQIQALAKADPRIRIIDKLLRRPQVLALYKCCDCYVSLHRAEGFGRGIAEALLLDKQVIATGFSGNLDFCTEERVGLVRYALSNHELGDYYHSGGQHWAEPDIDHAAELMAQICRNPRPISPRSFNFSPASVGTRYAKRLHEIRRHLSLVEGS